MKLGFIYCRFEILNPSFGFFPLNKIEFAESEVRVCPAGWLSVEMNKLLEFGRKAMFYVRVLSGYEERRIRSYRLELQRRLEQVFLCLLFSSTVLEILITQIMLFSFSFYFIR